jgi:hypothetical protein
MSEVVVSAFLLWSTLFWAFRARGRVFASATLLLLDQRTQSSEREAKLDKFGLLFCSLFSSFFCSRSNQHLIEPESRKRELQ